MRVCRIVANLLDNADRHAGGATAVEIGQTGNQAWVAVDDAGPGVPDDQREGIFTRFATSPTAGSTVRTHLGLALARQAARTARGDLIVCNRDGPGSRFLLLLPLAPPPTPA